MRRKDEIKYMTRYLKRKQRLERSKKKICGGLEFVYLIVREHWVAIVAVVISIYLCSFKFFETGDWVFVVAGFVILMLGVALDVRKQFSYGI